MDREISRMVSREREERERERREGERGREGLFC